MKYSLYILSITLLFSCNANKEETVTQNSATIDSTVAATGTPETPVLIWRATPEYEKVKTAGSGDTLPLDSLIKGLNDNYPNVKLEKLKQSHDTLYTLIKDSEYLTQRMGSTGAEIYVADVILNLTTVPGVQYVNIEFEEGDHAGPGTWSKENFSKFKEKKSD